MSGYGRLLTPAIMQAGTGEGGGEVTEQGIITALGYIPARRNVINLLDQGAMPSAIAQTPAGDSYAAIQAVLDTARDGDEVYLPRGFYHVSQALNPKNHGVIVNFAGVICPFGSYTGYLMDVDPVVATRYTRIVDVYGIRPQIHIRRLTLDGLHQSRGLRMYRAEHFIGSDITIHRILGNAFRCRVTREATFHNLQIHQSNGNIDGTTQEPIFWIGETVEDAPNGANGLRFYDMGIVYCGGTNIKIEGRTGAGNQVRMISFYSPQIHYSEADRNFPWLPIENNLELITIKQARNIQFFGGNLRLAGAGPGSKAVTVGDADFQVTDIAFYDTVFSGEASDQTGVYVADAAHAAQVRLNDAGFRYTGANATQVDAPAGVVSQVNSADLTKRIYDRPLHSPLDSNTFLMLDKSGYSEPQRMPVSDFLPSWVATIDPALAHATMQTQGVVDRIVYYRVNRPAVISGLAIEVGTSSGNISLAVYRNAGAGLNAVPVERIATTGAIPCPAAGYAELFFGSNVAHDLDWYAMSVDNTTATFRPGAGVSAALNNDLFKGRAAFQNTAHPAPATATPLPGVSRMFVIRGIEVT